MNTYIRTDFGFTLPVKHKADVTIFIGDKYTYSEEGYVPDCNLWKIILSHYHTEIDFEYAT